MKRLIQRVWKAKKQNQKLITIPAKSEIIEGDYVSIEKVNINNLKGGYTR